MLEGVEGAELLQAFEEGRVHMEEEDEDEEEGTSGEEVDEDDEDELHDGELHDGPPGFCLCSKCA